MTKIGKAPEAPQPTEESDVAAEKRRADLKRAIEVGVLGPLGSTHEGVDPEAGIDEEPGLTDLDIEPDVDVAAQEEAQSWEEAVVKMKKQKAKRAASKP